MPRLSAHERKADILNTITPLLAQKGFDGVSTRELAQAAGVSEALLFRHFPNKESLYVAIQEACKGGIQSAAENILEMPKNISTLLFGMYFLNYSLFPFQSPDNSKVTAQLILNSLKSDGEFAKTMMQHMILPYLQFFTEVYQHCQKKGEIHDNAIPIELNYFFTKHLAGELVSFTMSRSDILPYKASAQELCDYATLFSLRGMGVKDQVLKKHYKPELFREQIQHFFQNI